MPWILLFLGYIFVVSVMVVDSQTLHYGAEFNENYRNPQYELWLITGQEK